MGLSLGGLTPAIAASLRHSVPAGRVGRILGYNVSAQYAGQVLGPTAGGFLAAAVGMRCVFYATAVILLTAASLNIAAVRQTASKAEAQRVDKGKQERENRTSAVNGEAGGISR